MAEVFITGATGYVGTSLCRELAGRGHNVRALARAGSEGRVPPKCTTVAGNALDSATFLEAVRGCDTLVHLVGVGHPSPAKAAEFRSIDLVSAREAVAAAQHAGVRHFVYVGVAHPAPVMRAYIEARCESEEAVRASGVPATVLRPWYVLGPGHRWPYLLVPLYWVMGALPATRASAGRLGLVTLAQMVRALAYAVEHPAAKVEVFDVPRIRRVA